MIKPHRCGTNGRETMRLSITLAAALAAIIAGSGTAGATTTVTTTQYSATSTAEDIAESCKELDAYVPSGGDVGIRARCNLLYQGDMVLTLTTRNVSNEVYWQARHRWGSGPGVGSGGGQGRVSAQPRRSARLDRRRLPAGGRLRGVGHQHVDQRRDHRPGRHHERVQELGRGARQALTRGRAARRDAARRRLGRARRSEAATTGGGPR